MRYWVYKCNARAPSYAGSWGDWWADVFEPDRERVWGLTTLKGVDDVRVGDVLLAYQTDRNELVGTARVTGFKPDGPDRRIVIVPTEIIRAKVRPLKRDPRIRALSALAPGDIRTAYAIEPDDAFHLLRAARESLIKAAPPPPLDSETKATLVEAAPCFAAHVTV